MQNFLYFEQTHTLISLRTMSSLSREQNTERNKQNELIDSLSDRDTSLRSHTSIFHRQVLFFFFLCLLSSDVSWSRVSSSLSCHVTNLYWKQAERLFPALPSFLPSCLPSSVHRVFESSSAVWLRGAELGMLSSTNQDRPGQHQSVTEPCEGVVVLLC